MLKFAVTEEEKDSHCYSELAEKCERVLKMQNEYDQKHLPSNISKSYKAVEHNDMCSIENPPIKTSLEDKKFSHSSPFCPNRPQNDNLFLDRRDNDGNRGDGIECGMLSEEVNGVFYAQPINVISNAGSQEILTENLDKRTVEKSTSRYYMFTFVILTF